MQADRRVKVSKACEECRRKKVKCDDIVPACANCQKAALSCRRRLPGKHWSVSARSSVNSRRRQSDGSAEKRKASLPPLAPRLPSSDIESQDVHRDREDGLSAADQLPESSLNMLNIFPSKESVSGFFGGSSASSFMRQIQNVVDERLGSGRAIVAGQGYVLPSTKSAKEGQHSVSSTSDFLPPKTLSDDLFAAYWQLVHPIYPFLERSQTEADYAALWSRTPRLHADSTFACILFCMLAISCQSSELVTLRERKQQAKILYSQAKSQLNNLQFVSVAQVQCYLLMAQYLQSTDEHHQCWITTGLAVRTAQSIGLHLPETSERATSRSSREMMRRVWHGCALMERITAMAYGRPLIVHKSVAGSVPLPEPDIDQQSVRHRKAEPDFVWLFIESIKLFRLFSFVMLRFYASHPSLSLREGDLIQYISGTWATVPGDEGRNIISLDRDLARWRKDVPAHLANLPPPSATSIADRQAVVLYQRYLHIKILTTRPILAAVVVAHAGNKPGETDDTWIDKDTLSYHLVRQASIICIRHAQQAIKVVYDRLAENSTCLSERWYNVMYVYTAAAVLVAARLTGALHAEVSTHDLDEDFVKAICVLERYQPEADSVTRLLETLKLLHEKVPNGYQQHTIDRIGPSIETGNNNTYQTYPSTSTFHTANTFHPAAAEAQTDQAIDNGQSDHLDPFEFIFDPADLSWLNELPLCTDYPTWGPAVSI